MVKKKIFLKMRKFFILPLFVFVFLASLLFANANNYVEINDEVYSSTTYGYHSEDNLNIPHLTYFSISNFDENGVSYYYFFESDYYRIRKLVIVGEYVNFYTSTNSYVSLDDVREVYDDPSGVTFTLAFTGNAFNDDFGNVLIFGSDDLTIMPYDYYVTIYTKVDGNESFLGGLLSAITGSLKQLGSSIVNFVKTGFVQLFVNVEVIQVNGVDTNVYHASPIAWFTFALMGLALAMSLTYFLVNLLRRSK